MRSANLILLFPLLFYNFPQEAHFRPQNSPNVEQQLKQEKTVNKAWQVKIKECKKKIVDLGVDPNNPLPIKNLMKEKDTDIQILKKKLKIPE